MKQITSQITSKVYALILLLLLSQTAGLLHAEVHPFHDHDEVCDAFQLVEHQVPGLVIFTPFLATEFSAIFQPKLSNVSPYIENYGRFHIRAPPVVS